MLRQARGWLAKALSIDETDDVAREFMHEVSLIFTPTVQTLGLSSCLSKIDEPGLDDSDSADVESKGDSSEDELRDVRMALSLDLESDNTES